MPDDPDLTEFLDAASTQSRGTCGIATLMQRLEQDPDDPGRARRLRAALAAPVNVINHKAIVDVLGDWGITFSRNVVSHHRNGGCSCG